MPNSDVSIHVAHLATIDSATLYRILALRIDVFVLEQACAYRELDGRDLEAAARLVWAERGGDVLATLRLLVDTDGGARIGRVCTAVRARGQGLAAQIMTRTLDVVGRCDVVLDAQSPLVHWYAQFGFERDGDDFVEDGIAHTPMRLKSADTGLGR